MISLAQQIAIAGRQARIESVRQRLDARAKAARQAEIRAKQWASRKAGGNGIPDEVFKVLPATAETAITLLAIKLLLADRGYRDGSISGALSNLVKAKRVQRTGERREYRYHRSEAKQP